MTPPTIVELVLPALPESVARARVATGELARRLGLAERVVDDVRLAVTEAAANAVRHAYVPGARGDLGSGPARSRARWRSRSSTAVAGSRRPRALGTPDGLGIGMGLPLMRSLADDVRVEETPGGGCTVTLRFSRPAAREPSGLRPAATG